MDSRRDDAHRRNPPASTAAPSVSLDAFFPRALNSGVQGQRKPRRRPLIPRPRRLLPSILISAAGDWPLLQWKRVGTLSGGQKTGGSVPLAKEKQGQGRRRRSEAERGGLRGLSPVRTYSPEEANRRPPPSQVIMTHFCMQGLVNLCGCRGVVGKRGRPRPINRHAAFKAAGYWRPRRFALAPSLLC